MIAATTALLRPALFAHLLGLTAVAGGDVTGLAAHVTLGVVRRAPGPPGVPAGLGALLPRAGMVATAGALLSLASGVALVAARGWADWGAPWLTAKLACFVLLFANGLLVAKPTGALLGAAMARGDADTADAAFARLTRFHWVQTAGLLTLVALGVFGPR